MGKLLSKALMVVLCILSSVSLVSSQNENNNWYFGRFAGLSFNSSPPIAITNSVMNTPAASASISDEEGNLLFYTNSATVWNRFHIPMENGTGLSGNTVSTQVRIVPLPDSDHLYYIFTVDRLGWPQGLRYSIVNMNAGGGLGAVTSKNILMEAPVSEKLAVIPACNELDRWIIAHGVASNRFVTYLLTPNGLEGEAVESFTGSTHQNGPGAVGYMKASQQGDKLAAITRIDEEIGRCEIFNFNRATGEVASWVLLDSLNHDVYGLEFSPDGSKLYFATGTDINGKVFQVDLNASTLVAIQQSVLEISGNISLNSQVSALQIGPDDNIYLAKRNNSTLAVIHAPDQLGLSCMFEDNAIDLAGRNSKSGLPDRTVSRKDDPEIVLIEKSCAGMTSLFQVDNLDQVDSVRWHFGDPNSGTNNTSTQLNAEHSFSSSGHFKVAVDVFHPCRDYRLSFQLQIDGLPEIEIPESILLCDDETSTIDLSHVNAELTWHDGFAFPVREFKDPGTFTLTATNHCGSINYSIAVETFASLDLGQGRSVCPNEPIVLQPTWQGPQGLLEWQNGFSGQFFEVTEPGTYTVTATFEDCVLIDAVNITEGDCESNCTISFVPNVFTPNYDGVNDEFKPFGCVSGNYQLLIFDRWGSLIFESTAIDEGWDGTFHGRLVIEGIYVWMIAHEDNEGNPAFLKGDVLVLR